MEVLQHSPEYSTPARRWPAARHDEVHMATVIRADPPGVVTPFGRARPLAGSLSYV